MAGTVVDIAIITAIYGGYDTLKPLPDSHGFSEAVCVTDDPRLSASGWTVKVVAGGSDYRLSAKVPKLTPFRFVDSESALWIDGSTEVSATAHGFCSESQDGRDLLAWQHPEGRDCLFQEAAYCQDWPQNRHMPLREQTAHYRAEGMPEHYGLYACGVLLWRNTPYAREFGEMWLDENRRWSTRDQVSFPYILWKRPINFGLFPAHQLKNPHFRVGTHLLRR